jgi:hypothetical protein
VKRLKDILSLLAGEVEEIVDSDVRAVAAVDRPATDRRWRFFKAANAGITTTLPDDDQETPAGHVANSSVAPLMKPDMAGSEAKVTTLTKIYDEIEDALAKGELKAVPEDRDRDTYERCIEKVMAQGNDKSSAFAICTAGGAGKEKGAMKHRKDEAVAAAPPPASIDEVEAAAQGVPQEPETIEIPATPTEWKLGDCVNQASSLGMDHQQAVNACAIVYGDYGDPEDEETILVPDGNTPEGLLNAAATRMGLKMTFASPPEPVKLTGRNIWSAFYKRFLGRRTRSGAVEYLKGLESRLEGVVAEQAKSREDLRYVVDKLIANQSQAMQTMAALAGVPLPAPAPVTPETEPDADETKTAPVAGAKDGAAAGAPVAPPAQGTEERIAALEQALQQILAAVGGGGDVPDPEDDEDQLMAPPLPNKRISLPVANPANRLHIGAKSAPGQRPGTQYSSMYGVTFSAAERAAAINNSTGLQSIGRK